MSEIILKFSDKGDDGHFEMNKAQRAVRADEVYSLLWDVDQKLRSWYKYDESVTEREANHIETIREMIGETGLLELFD